MSHFITLRTPRIRMSGFYSLYLTECSISLLVGLGHSNSLGKLKLQFRSDFLAELRLFHVQKSTKCTLRKWDELMRAKLYFLIAWVSFCEIIHIFLNGDKLKFAKLCLAQGFVLWTALCQLMQMLSISSIIMPAKMNWPLAIGKC